MPIVPIGTCSTGPQTEHLTDQHRSLPPARHRSRLQPPTAAQPEKSSSDYVVGYGRPPAHTRFQPGRSGNPKGRPKAAKGLKTIARDVLTARVPVRTATGEKKMHRIEAVMHKTVELAMKGNPRALAEILKLYALAVPETAAIESTTVSAEELTAGDLAILEELKAGYVREASQ